MIKRNNKKGFTIVELVIVIAVIAILAAVLIPTFAGIIRKANISADTQLVKNMNTALTADEAINGPAEDFNEVIAIVRDAGYVLSAFNPTTEGCYVVWDSESNQLLLVDSKKDFAVIYSVSDDYAEPGKTWCFAVDDEKAKTALETHYGKDVVTIKMAVSDVENLGALLDKGGEQTIYIDESVVISKDNLLVFDVEGAKTTIDLGSAALNTSGILPSDGANIVPVEIQAGTVTFNGGYISTAGEARNAHDLPIKISVRTRDNTTTNFVGSTFENTNNGGQIKIGGNGTMEDVTVKSSKIGVETFLNGKLTLKNTTVASTGVCIWACNYDHEKFAGTGDHTGDSVVTVESGKYSRTAAAYDKAAIVSCGGDVVIKDGDFSSIDYIFVFGSNKSGEIVISGGTFNGVAFAELDTVAEWEALCYGNVNVAIANGTVTITAK